MSHPSGICPTGFGLYDVNGVRACGKQTLSYGCDSVTFSTNISYSEVCGRVIGYQYGRPDGAHSSRPIDDPYIEGVSITHGSPRQHVWTLINGQHEISRNYCPCNTGSIASVPSFVGDNYFCESGTASSPTSNYTLTIHYGMVKDVKVMKVLVAMLLVFHGSIKFLILLLLTTLSYECVEIILMKILQLRFMRFM